MYDDDLFCHPATPKLIPITHCGTAPMLQLILHVEIREITRRPECKGRGGQAAVSASAVLPALVVVNQHFAAGGYDPLFTYAP